MLQNTEKPQSTYSIISFRVEHPGTNGKVLQILEPVLHQEPETTQTLYCIPDHFCLHILQKKENPNLLRV